MAQDFFPQRNANQLKCKFKRLLDEDLTAKALQDANELIVADALIVVQDKTVKALIVAKAVIIKDILTEKEISIDTLEEFTELQNVHVLLDMQFDCFDFDF